MGSGQAKVKASTAGGCRDESQRFTTLGPPLATGCERCSVDGGLNHTGRAEARPVACISRARLRRFLSLHSVHRMGRHDRAGVFRRNSGKLPVGVLSARHGHDGGLDDLWIFFSLVAVACSTPRTMHNSACHRGRLSHYSSPPLTVKAYGWSLSTDIRNGIRSTPEV